MLIYTIPYFILKQNLSELSVTCEVFSASCIFYRCNRNMYNQWVFISTDIKELFCEIEELNTGCQINWSLLVSLYISRKGKIISYFMTILET